MYIPAWNTMRASCWLWKGKFSKKGNFVFITQINLRTSSNTTFIVHNRSFTFFIGYENESFPEQWPFVLLTENNSCGKDIRRQLQNLLSLLPTTVASNQTKRSSICFGWESLNNRWVLRNIPMNAMRSQCFAKGLNHLSFLRNLE